VGAILRHIKHGKGNAIVVAPTSYGKSLLPAAVASRLGEPVLVFQPSLELLEQNLSKMHAYGINAGVFSASAGRKEVMPVTLATIGSAVNKPHLFKGFRHVVIDECFPAGTMIGGVPIEMICAGDIVDSFNHETGRVEQKRVVRTFFKMSNRMIRVSFTNGTSFICTPNHPVYTIENGYIRADELTSNHTLIEHGSPLHDLPKTSTSSYRTTTSIVQAERASILRKRMQQRSASRSKEERCHYSRIAASYSESVVRKNEEEEPNVDAWSQGENDCQVEGKEICIERREWPLLKAPAITTKGNWPKAGARHSNKAGTGDIRQHALQLQGRPSSSGYEAGNRGGREGTPNAHEPHQGQKEGASTCRTRVDRVEVYEQGGGDGLDSVRGYCAVYNFEVEDNNNYFANGILVHNCHLSHGATSTRGNETGATMYKKFLSAIGNPRLTGLTATPFRLASNSLGSENRFITRMKNSLWDEVIYVKQIGELKREGYLADMEYFYYRGIDPTQLVMNRAGSDYTDASVRAAMMGGHWEAKVINILERLLKHGRKSILVFTPFVNDSERIASFMPDVAKVVHGEMRPEERRKVIADFKEHRIPIVLNCQVLGIGFDHPSLDTIVDAAPTTSMSKWYQRYGRGLRIHPDKKSTYIVDMWGSTKVFGKVEDLVVQKDWKGKWMVSSNGKQLTNVILQKPNLL